MILSSLVLLVLSLTFVPGSQAFAARGWNYTSAAGGKPNALFDWTSQGKDFTNTRNVTKSLVTNSSLLLSTPAFVVSLGYPAVASPAIIVNAIFIPTQNGSLVAVNQLTGATLWVVDVGMAYYGANVSGTRVISATPTPVGSILSFVKYR